MGRRTEMTFSQRRHTNGQPEQEKFCDIIKHSRNANQNNEISPCTC